MKNYSVTVSQKSARKLDGFFKKVCFIIFNNELNLKHTYIQYVINFTKLQFIIISL